MPLVGGAKHADEARVVLSGNRIYDELLPSKPIDRRIYNWPQRRQDAQ
jgi:hypothetical protein